MTAPDASRVVERRSAWLSAARPALRLATKVRPVWWGSGVLVLIVMYFTSTQSTFYVFTLNTVLLAAIGAIALNLLMGTAGQASIGNAAFLAVGSFSAVFAVRSGIAFPLDVAFAGVVAAAAGVVVGIPALRLKGLYLVLATLSAHFIVIFVATRYESSTVAASGFSVPGLFSSQGYAGSQRSWAWFLLILVVILALCVSRLMKERSGRAWRMVREHEYLAPVFGIQPARYKLIAFAVSSMIIGAQGALLAHLNSSVDVTTFTIYLAVQYLAMVLIGGLDSIAGSVIGAAVIVCLPVFAPNAIQHIGLNAATLSRAPQIAEIAYGVLIIVFIVGSPNGIIGWVAAIRRRLEASAPGVAMARKWSHLK